MSEITIYTDGSCKEFNGVKHSGWGFYGVNDEIKFEIEAYGPAGKNVSHNVAELEAAVNALRFAIDNDYTTINLLLDSEYVIQCMNRIDIVEESGYDNVKNAEYRKKLALLKNEILSKNITVEFNWNKGHSGIEGNEKADRLAARGVLAEKANENAPTFIWSGHIKETEKKVKVEIDPMHTLLTGKRWFFKTNINNQLSDGRYFYGTATFEESKKLGLKYAGKPAPDTHYNVVLSKNPIKSLDNIKGMFEKEITSEIAPVLVNLSMIRKPEIVNELENRIHTFLDYKKGLALNTDKEIVATIIKPPRLVWRMSDYFDFGYELIRKYETNDPSILVVDCTKSFINTSEKGKQEMNKEFDPAAKTIKIKVDLTSGKEIYPLLSTGIDIPTRNQINNMIKEDPKEPIKISIVIWHLTNHSYNCGLIIERKGDIGIYFTTEASYRIISIK